MELIFWFIIKLTANIILTLEVFVGQPGNPNTDALENGTSAFPFLSLNRAFSFLEEHKSSLELEKNEIILDNGFHNYTVDAALRKNYFENWNEVSIAVRGGFERSIILGSIFPSFKIRKGSISFINIEFKKIENNQHGGPLVFCDERGFIVITFDSCRFSYAGENTLSENIFMDSLIEIIAGNENQIISWQSEIYFKNTQFLNTFFGKNIIFLPRDDTCLEPLKKLILINITMENTALRSGKESFLNSLTEFAFYVNNCELSLINAKFINVSRLLLASTSRVFIKNLSFNSLIDIENAVEILCFFEKNYVQIDQLEINNLTIKSRDDKVNREVDDVLMDGKNFVSVNVEDFEKSQAMIKALYENIIIFISLEISDLNMIRKNNLYFSFFTMAKNNYALIKNSRFINISIDTLSDFGMSLFIYLQEYNKLEIDELIISQISMNTFSMALFFACVLKNELNFQKLNLNYSFFLHKATQRDVIEFYNLAEYFGNNIGAFMELKTESFKVSSFVALMGANKFILNGSILTNIQCLGNCITIALAYNHLFLFSAVVRNIESGLMSSAFLCLYTTQLVMLNTEITDSISIGGPLLLFHYNILTVNFCFFYQNIALSVIGKEIFAKIMIAGNLFLGNQNVVSIGETKFSDSKTDTFGGGFTAQRNNQVELLNCSFFNIESINRDSKGSVVMVFNNNSIIFTNVTFFKTLGYLGAILYSNELNKIIFENCLFNDSIGIDGGAFYLNESTTLIMRNCLLEAITSKVSGILMANLTGHNIILYNCTLLGNGINLRDCLIKMEYGNFLSLKYVILNYQINMGVGSFITCNSYNFIEIQTSSFTNASDLYSLINLQINNTLLIDKSNFSKVNTQILLADSHNNIFIKSIRITDCDPIDKKSVIFSLRLRNIIFIESSIVKNIEGSDGTLFYVIDSNILMINYLVISSIISNTREFGGVFYFQSSNKIIFNNTMFYDFIGEGPSVLMTFIEKNDFNIMHSNFTGLISLSINSKKNYVSCLFKILGTGNILDFKNARVNQTYNLLTSDKVEFFSLNGNDSTIIILNSNISVYNYSSFSRLNGNNYLIIIGSAFKYSHSFDHFFILDSVNYFIVKRTLFNQINIDSKSSIFYFKNIENGFIILSAFINNINICISYNSNLSIYKSFFKNAFDFDYNFTTLSSSYLNFTSSNISIRLSDFISTGNPAFNNIFVASSSINISKNTFLSNKASEGGVFHFTKVNSGVIINNNFLSNNGDNGGVLFLEDCRRLIIVNNLFKWNHAYKNGDLNSSRGGCIFFQASFKKIKSLLVENNFFLGNKANAGGVFFFLADYTKTELEINTFHNNKGVLYGNIYASRVKEFFIIPGVDFHNAKSTSITLKETLSISNETQSQACHLMIIAIDYFDEVLLDTIIFKETNIELSKNLIANFKIFRGCLCMLYPTVTLNWTSFQFSPEDIIRFEVTPTQILSQPPNDSNFGQNLTIKFLVRYCEIGEFLDTKYMLCKPCQINFYSVETNISKASSCLSCLNREFFCYGGVDLSPRKGYWRLNSSSFNFIKCPNNEGTIYLNTIL